MRKPKVYSENAHLLRDEAWLRLQYIDNNLSIRMIAKFISCSSLTVRRVLAKFNISIKQKHITYGDITYPPRNGKNSATWKGGNNKCIDCNELLATRTAFRCKKCQGIASRGENNPSWKPPEECYGGEAMQARNSMEYKAWRLSVWVRDKTKCQICGIRKDPMVAHHLDGFNLFPEKRFDVSNGITLCDFHHIAFHSNYGFGNNTKEQFEDFKIRTTEMTY